MVKAIVLYEREPDAERYAQHVRDFAESVPGAAFRHGKIVGAPIGDKRYAYYAEFEWPDMESFQAVARSEELAATGRDAAEMGLPHSIHLVEVE